MSLSRFAVLAAVVFAPFAAAAADLPVTYTVEEKPLKAAIAGTSLNFELYSDNNCTTLVQSIPVLVENVSLLSKLKQLTPKGDTKLPNTVELRTTLAVSPPQISFSLKVTSTNNVIRAVGGACQPQVSGVAGPAGATGAQGPAGPGTVVRDVNGALVGVGYFDGCGGLSNVLYNAGGTPIKLAVDTNSISGNECVYFSAAGCTGAAALGGGGACLVAASCVVGSTLYYANGSPVSTNYQSLTCGGPCSNASGTQVLAPAGVASLSALVPPFHLEIQ